MILLDVRELDHPLPLEMAIDAFKKLSNTDVLRLIHRREPIPLFEILTKNGGFYLSQEISDGVWHITITRNPHLDLEPYRV